MDPLACFKRFCEAINDYDFDEMMSAIDDLRTWCRKGGFLPEEIPITFEGWKNLWTMFQKVGVQQDKPRDKHVVLSLENGVLSGRCGNHMGSNPGHAATSSIALMSVMELITALSGGEPCTVEFLGR